MASTILVIGATGNTGQRVVLTCSTLLKDAKDASQQYRIVGLTRSVNGSAAQRLAKLEGVEMLELDWTTITSAWLRQQHVKRVYIAGHNEPSQFSEESAFYVAALESDIEYVVRVSTTTENVRPDSKAYYPRTHWAIETLLETDGFAKLRWTSLQPNLFSQYFLASAANFIRQYRTNGKQGTLRLMGPADVPAAIIDAEDVGAFAAHLLCTKDIQKHHKAKYRLSGPEDVTGRRVVQLVEQRIGEKVDNVSFKDESIHDAIVTTSRHPALMSSSKLALETVWQGKCSLSAGRDEDADKIAVPRGTVEQVLDRLL